MTDAGPGGPTTPTGVVPPVPLVNIANGLTVVRLLLVPVFLVVLFVDHGQSPAWRWAALRFRLASLSVSFDGDFAAGWGLVTDFRKIADPIADKALTGAALVGLSMLGELAWWVTITIAARELGVTLLRFWVLRHGVIPASRGGKIKTVVQTRAGPRDHAVARGARPRGRGADGRRRGGHGRHRLRLPRPRAAPALAGQGPGRRGLTAGSDGVRPRRTRRGSRRAP